MSQRKRGEEGRAKGKKSIQAPKGKSRIREAEREKLVKRAEVFGGLAKGAFAFAVLPVGIALYDKRSRSRVTMGLIAVGLVVLGIVFKKLETYSLSKADSMDTKKPSR
jgi:hypothetical protein